MDMQELRKKASEKGYLSLSKEEKDFYQANKDETPSPIKQEDVITLKKEDLDKVIDSLVTKKLEAYQASNSKLQDQVKGLESTAGLRDWQVWQNPVEKNKTATFRVYQVDGDSKEGLIVDRKFLKNAYDEEFRDYTSPIYKITVLYDDGKTANYELPLVDLTKLPGMETVEIISMDRKKMAKSYGKVSRTALDNSGYKLYKGGDGSIMAVQSDDEVDALVFMDEGTCVCKRQSGQEFIVNINRLNCA